jgi:hypothetical protein
MFAVKDSLVKIVALWRISIFLMIVKNRLMDIISRVLMDECLLFQKINIDGVIEIE